jgi:hypothetical protein
MRFIGRSFKPSEIEAVPRLSGPQKGQRRLLWSCAIEGSLLRDRRILKVSVLDRTRSQKDDSPHSSAAHRLYSVAIMALKIMPKKGRRAFFRGN